MVNQDHAIAPERLDLAGDIPALVWRGAGPPPHPVIVSLHGLSGSKRDIDPDVSAYVTSRGVTLVTLDAYMHGERAPASGFDLDAYREPGIFVDLFAHTAHDVVAAVAQLDEDPAVGRIGLRGGSVGGFIVLTAIGLGADAVAVLSVCGGADWANTFMRVDSYTPTQLTLQQVAEADPILHLDRFPPKPLLLIHGMYDEVVPIAGHRHLFDALAPLYRERPEDCLLITHAGAHPTPKSLEEFGWTWLIEQIR